MTDTELEQAKPLLRRAHRRTRPPERADPQGLPDTPRHPNGAPDELAAMLARLERLEGLQQGQYVEQTPAPRPTARIAPPESLTPFQARLAARARPTPREIPHELPYNYPLRWYARPDGEIVQLQGDPQNRAMYQDLGFHLLEADEVESWENGERDKAIALQREKAGIITALRSFALRTPGYVLEFDQPHTDEAFSDMSIERLHEVHREIEQEKGSKIRIPKPKPAAKVGSEAAVSGIESGSMDPRMAALLDGTRTGNGPRSIELQPGQPRNFV